VIPSRSRRRKHRGDLAVVLTLALCVTGWFGGGHAASPSSPSGSFSPTAGMGLHGVQPFEEPAPAPPGSVGNISITIHNPSPNSTGPYQQPVAINSSRYASLINANWSNAAAFYTSNGTPIYAWIESGASNTSTDTLIWLRLASLPGGGWTNVSIFFWPTTSFNLSESGYMGEAPELSSPYASFDNGWQVFDAYSNFSGTVMGPQWTPLGSWTGTVHAGLHIVASAGMGAIETSLGGSFSSNATVDAYAWMNQTSGPLGLFMAETPGFSAEHQFFPNAYAFDPGYGGSQYAALQISNSTGAWKFGTPPTLAPVDFTQAYHVLGLSWSNATSDENASANYLRFVSTVDTTSAPMTQMGLAGFCATNCTSWDVSWIRSRNAPEPMPLVSSMGFSPLAVGVVASPPATDVGRFVTFTCNASGGSGSYNYSWTFGDSRTGSGRTATFVYTRLGTFEASCTASDGTGATGNSTATVIVNPNPAIVLFQALPSSLQLGVSLNLITNVSGGTPPLRFTYSGLPPGCPTRNSTSLSCLPGETGTFAIEVTVTDAVDVQTSSFVTITVAPAPVPQNSTPFSPAEGYAIGGAVAGVVVLAGVLPVVWWARRRPPGGAGQVRGPDSDSDPAEEE
jgi:hypothetical protein